MCTISIIRPTPSGQQFVLICTSQILQAHNLASTDIVDKVNHIQTNLFPQTSPSNQSMYVWEPKQDTVKQGLEHNQTHVKAAIICSDMKRQICYRLIHIEKVDLACMLLYVQMKQKSE
jgi:hypothetical protein